MKKIFLIPLLALFLVAGTANAQVEDLPKPGILPGNPLHILEIVSEGIGTLFTFGDVAKAERHLALAGERLAEASALAEKGKANRAEKATGKYQERLDKALAKTEDAKKAERDTDAVLEKIAEAMIRHQEVLAGVYEKVPEQAKEAIQKAMENSARGYEIALDAVSKEKQEEVRSRVEQDTKDVEERLEDLRKQGLPVPSTDKVNIPFGEMSLEMKTWKWIKTVYNDDTEVTPEDSEAFTITFKDDSTFSVTTDCNAMSGGYEVEDNKITFGNVATTLMFCENSQEQEFLKMLGEVQSFLFTSRGELVFELKIDSGSVILR